MVSTRYTSSLFIIIFYIWSVLFRQKKKKNNEGSVVIHFGSFARENMQAFARRFSTWNASRVGVKAWLKNETIIPGKSHEAFIEAFNLYQRERWRLQLHNRIDVEASRLGPSRLIIINELDLCGTDLFSSWFRRRRSILRNVLKASLWFSFPLACVYLIVILMIPLVSGVRTVKL